MIYFTLPNFYNNINLNSAICAYFGDPLNHKKMIAPVKFIASSGSYPYSYHNGGINNNKGQLLRYSDYEKIISFGNFPVNTAIRLDLSNIYLTEKDFDDCMLNTILNTHHNGSTQIELWSIGLLEYIKSNYPNFSYIFSANADIINPINSEIINSLIDSKEFELISLPIKYNRDIEFLKQIQSRKCLELTVNDICVKCTESQHLECKGQENECQYYYSQKSPITNCKKRMRYNMRDTVLISLDDIKTIYLPLGITHFKLCEYLHTKNHEIDFIFFFIEYFVKPEYQKEVLNYLLKEVNK